MKGERPIPRHVHTLSQTPNVYAHLYVFLHNVEEM